MDQTPQKAAEPGQGEIPAYPADRVRIVSTSGTCGGRPRIDGHRITVEHIVLCHQRCGQSPDEIASDYPSITLTDVYAALAFYHENRDRIDADIIEGERFVEEMKAKAPPSPLRQKLAAMGLDYEELISTGDTDQMLAKLRKVSRRD